MSEVSLFKIAMSSHHIAHPGKTDENKYQRWDKKGILGFALLTIFSGGLAAIVILSTAAVKLKRLNKQAPDSGLAKKVDQSAGNAGIKQPSSPTTTVDDKKEPVTSKDDKNKQPFTTPAVKQEKPLTPTPSVEKKPVTPTPAVKQEKPVTPTPLIERVSTLEKEFFKKVPVIATGSLEKDLFKKEVAKILEDDQLDIDGKAQALKKSSDDAIAERKFYFAESFLIEAAKLGHDKSFLLLAQFYRKEIRDNNLAYECLLISAIKEVPNADELLGSTLTSGEGFNKNALEAAMVFPQVPIIIPESEKSSCIKIGRFLKNIPADSDQAKALKREGKKALLTKNYDEAERYFIASAKLGHAKSFRHLGELYRDQNKKDSLVYDCFRAGALQDPLAAEQLGHLYLKGLGTQKDLSKALECFNQAAAVSPEAKRLAEELKAEMASLEKAPEENKPKSILITFDTFKREGTPCIIINTEGSEKSQHDKLARAITSDENKLEAIEILPGNEYCITYNINRGYLIYMKVYEAGDPDFDPGATFKKAYENTQKAVQSLNLGSELHPGALEVLNKAIENFKQIGENWVEFIDPAYKDIEELYSSLKDKKE